MVSAVLFDKWATADSTMQIMSSVGGLDGEMMKLGPLASAIMVVSSSLWLEM